MSLSSSSRNFLGVSPRVMPWSTAVDTCLPFMVRRKRSGLAEPNCVSTLRLLMLGLLDDQPDPETSDEFDAPQE